MLYIKLAWRNLWRNRRRTLITMVSIVVAVLLAAVMRSMQEGQYEVMIDTTVGSFTGYIQIHQQGYWEDKTLDNTLVESDSLYAKIQQQSSVEEAVPRLESFALAAGKNLSRPAMVMGIHPQAEQALSDPKNRLQSGSYLDTSDEHSVLIGREMIQRLNVQVGDSLVLIGQGFRGQRATGLYEIKGTVSFPNPELNRSIVMMPIQTAQEFLAAPDRLTSISLILNNPDNVNKTAKDLRNTLSPDRYEVMTWQELAPELVQSIQADRGSGIIIIMILYIIVGFGILGTVLMMITERSYEFGVMISVGTPRLTIAAMLAMEILLIAFMGSGIGLLLSIPVAWYFNINPIEFSGNMAEVMESYGLEPFLPFSLSPEVFYGQAIIIFIITLVFSIIPIVKASKLNPVNAMRA